MIQRSDDQGGTILAHATDRVDELESEDATDRVEEPERRANWRSRGQLHHVKGWGQQEESANGTLNCMWRTQRPTSEIPCEEADDEEGDHLICTMRGTEWEPMPYPIIIDPGASASTLPRQWCQHVKLLETEECRAGQTFNAANGQEIPNLGRRSVTLMTRESAIRDMMFEVCNVTRALGSVSQMCKAGHRVTFNPPWDPEGSYIEHVEIGQRMWLTEKDGIYLLDVRVAPEQKQTINH